MKEQNIDGHISNNFGGVILSCYIEHDLEWEHRVPDHAIIYVRSGQFVIEGKERTVTVGLGTMWSCAVTALSRVLFLSKANNKKILVMVQNDMVLRLFY